MEQANTIIVQAKEHYGKVNFYPSNALADKLARLVGNKTLTETVLRQAKDMGFNITINQPQVKVSI